MEEKVLNMEYNINGEKYIITATKVNEDEVVTPATLQNTDNTNVEECDCPCCDCPCEDCQLFEAEDVMIVNASQDIPDCLTIDEWLEIIDKYGIIILK